MVDKSVEKGVDEGDTGKRQATVERLADTPRKYAVDGILHHVGDGDKVRYVERW